MHDPLTVAHEIKIPLFFKRENTLYRDNRKEWQFYQLATIWHKDPERGGSDDSCGFGYIRLTKKQREICRNAAWAESYHPHFLICREKEWNGTHADAESLYRGLVALVDRVLHLKMSYEEICRYATEAVHIRNGGCGKYGGAFCFLPGYHTNHQDDDRDSRQDHFTGILCSVASCILTSRRPWWRHPRWHIHHWRIQVHPLQQVWNWLFTRCSKCGGRFHWNETRYVAWSGNAVWHDRCQSESKPST